jgi:hypothetical protein
MKTIALLKAGKAIIAKPENWTKFYLATDKYGRLTPLKSPDACKWCMSGAIHRAAHDLGYVDEYGNPKPGAVDIFNDICETFKVITGKSFMSIFNDNKYTSHTDVMNVFDRAIAHYSGSEPKTMKML